MKDELIKKTFKEMKKKMPQTGKCPDEVDLARFAEGVVAEEESEGIEEHLVLCPKCCDYVVFFNKVKNFSVAESLPEVPDEQINKVSALVKDREKRIQGKGITNTLKKITQSIRYFFIFNWMAQPIPVAVRSGALVLLIVLIVSTTFLYYRTPPLGLQMELIGKTSMVPTRGVPKEKIIKEGDTLFSNDYCRINFELDQDAYAYVLYYDSTGKLHQLYPDPTIAIPPKVKGNTKYTIPEGEDKWFELDDNTGTETVFVLASHKPFSGFKETFNAVQGLSREEVLEVFKGKAAVAKVINFKHQ